MSVLTMRAVSRDHGTGAGLVHALRDVDLTVDAGEFAAVMGPSGSGKSTLLTLAGGLDLPTAGQVLLDGADLGVMKRAGLATIRRRRVGYVFQDLNLIPGLTTVENAPAGLRIPVILLTGMRRRAGPGPGRGLDSYRARTRGSVSRNLPHPIVHSQRNPFVSKPVVLVAEELSPAGIAVLESDFEVRHTDGADRAALLPAVADVDALIVRSATKVDAEVFAHARKLRVVARAGVGLDNVDVEAATKAGVMVVNAPTSNIVTAAEHAIALLLATARNVPQGHSALKQGEWKRSKYTGVELQGKTAGVLGLGRIGVLVAQRLAAFDMNVVAYDPYVQAARAAQLGVKLVTLDELLKTSDFITVHLPKTPETLGLVGDKELHQVKPTVRIVNAARGGIVDETALEAAIKEGRVAGAGLDVFSTEPCTDSPLFHHDNVVVTPHLGASTHEAQEKAGTQVAKSVKLALSGEFVPDAVNVQGGAVAEDVKPGLPLAEKLGRIFTALAGGVPVRLDVTVRGEITGHDVRVLELAALKGVFSDVVEESVTFVNAPLLARDRGVEVTLTTSEDSPDWRNVVSVKGTMADGATVSVSGTLTGPKHIERIIEVNGYDMEIVPTEHMAFLGYTDRPGIVGTVGKLLGDLDINIASMQVGRSAKGGKALIALTVDSAISPEVLDAIVAEIGGEMGRRVDLDG